MSQLPLEIRVGGVLPKTIMGYVSVKSKGGQSAMELGKLPKKTVAGFHSQKSDRQKAIKALESNGLNVIAESALGVAISGPCAAYESFTGGTMEVVKRRVRVDAARERYVSRLDIVGENQPDCCGVANAETSSARVEGLLVEVPQQYHGIEPSPIPPSVAEFHLRVPTDVAIGLNAHEAQRNGTTGSGVTVAMVDSGQYPHPFFVAHRYDVAETISVVPDTDPTADPVGHGTGESANIFAVAPGATLQAIRASDDAGNLVGAIGGFLRAKEGSPDILTNSWGGDGPFPPEEPLSEFDILWAIEILDAIEQGIFVVFSGGNGQFSIEPQVPGVLAAGGVHMNQTLDLMASNYCSGYESPFFNNVNVPDVCGLVGQLPRAQSIMLPLQPGCAIDVDASESQGSDSGDGTQPNDGWARFSGTSAAAPQVAGAAALILEAKPGLSPAQMTEALTETAVDITTGRCHPRFDIPAVIGHDVATGHGLVDASAAVAYAVDNF